MDMDNGDQVREPLAHSVTVPANRSSSMDPSGGANTALSDELRVPLADHDWDEFDEPLPPSSAKSLPSSPESLNPDSKELDVDETLPDPGSLAEMARIEPPVPEEEAHEPAPEPEPTMRDLVLCKRFIDKLKTVTLDEEKFSPEMLERLWNPPTILVGDEIDPLTRLSLDIYLATSLSSNETYNDICTALQRFNPNQQLLSLDQIKRLLPKLTGVVPMTEDMCPKSCTAFVGAHQDLEQCPYCKTSRWDQWKLAESRGKLKVAARTFDTIHIGPQLQALLRSPETAGSVHYRAEKTAQIFEELNSKFCNGNGESLPALDVYSDIYHGSVYLEVVKRRDIGKDDLVLMLSIDSVQLYQMKQSDCWMYLWVVLDHVPDVRYKKRYILPGNIIPGPNKPKNINSFLYPGLHHLVALQREGLKMWDSSCNQVYTSQLHFHIGAADGPGMATINGLTGHQGQQGCHVYCGLEGRHMNGGNHYFPAALQAIGDCEQHPDVDLHQLRGLDFQQYNANLRQLMLSPNPTCYKERRLETGIVKPSIFSGLSRITQVPSCFVLDGMHLILNLTDLFSNLWHGTLYVEGNDSKDQ